MWGVFVVVFWLIGFCGIFCYCTNNFLRAKHANNSNNNNNLFCMTDVQHYLHRDHLYYRY